LKTIGRNVDCPAGPRSHQMPPDLQQAKRTTPQRNERKEGDDETIAVGGLDAARPFSSRNSSSKIKILDNEFVIGRSYEDGKDGKNRQIWCHARRHRIAKK